MLEKTRYMLGLMHYNYQGVCVLLAFTFFALIFSSALWLIYSLTFIVDSLSGVSLFEAGLANVLIYALLVCVPIFLVWAIFGYVNQYLNNKMVNMQLRKLMIQMKKNQDYSDLLARTLIETKQNANSGMVLGRFDLLVADLNELLSEIIRDSKLASPEQIESLWRRAQNGSKWSFGRVIVEVSGAQKDFGDRMLKKTGQDAVLGGTIMEFCSRYQSVVAMLEKYDRDKLFLDMIETGVMGKVYSVLRPISDEIYRGRAMPISTYPEPTAKKDATLDVVVEQTSEMKEDVSTSDNDEGFFQKINPFKKRSEAVEEFVKDPFSIALERSFADDEIPSEVNTPVFTDAEFINSSVKAEVTDTQKTLDNLKREWTETRISGEDAISKENEEDNLIYPFGSWADEQNYQK